MVECVGFSIIFMIMISSLTVHSTQTTQYYGETGADSYEIINIGTMAGIISWGIENKSYSISNMVFTNDMNSNSENITDTDPVQSCKPFTLNDDEYIIGYRVVYSSVINGLGFFTNHASLYECIANESNLGNNYVDTGYKFHLNNYLSAIYVQSLSNLDSIAFQFTPICNSTSVTKSTKNVYTVIYQWMSLGIIAVFMVIAMIGYVDAKYIRKNDFFRVSSVISAMISISDMVSDVFFSMDVWYLRDDHFIISYLLIFELSLVFIIIPIIISLIQLHSASKYWLNNNKVRSWLMSHSKYLYFISIITGSSFCAIHIFNCNLFRFHIFDMGLTKRYLLSWSTKRIYSMVIFENIPQLLLVAIYSFILGRLDYIPVASIIFSLISVIATIMAIIVKKKIHFTQDLVNITMDITGQCIIDNLNVCKYTIYGIKSFLCKSMGIDWNAIDIEKPMNISNGIRLKIHILNIHGKTNIINPGNHYHHLLNISIYNASLAQKMKNVWKLYDIPRIENIQSQFIKSMAKQKKQHNTFQKKVVSKQDKSDEIELLAPIGQYQPPIITSI